MRHMEHPLRSWRKTSGLTLDAVSALTGESKSKLSRIENGRQDPDLAFMRKAIRLTRGKVTGEDFVRYQPQAAD